MRMRGAWHRRSPADVTPVLPALRASSILIAFAALTSARGSSPSPGPTAATPTAGPSATTRGASCSFPAASARRADRRRWPGRENRSSRRSRHDLMIHTGGAGESIAGRRRHEDPGALHEHPHGAPKLQAILERREASAGAHGAPTLNSFGLTQAHDDRTNLAWHIKHVRALAGLMSSPRIPVSGFNSLPRVLCDSYETLDCASFCAHSPLHADALGHTISRGVAKAFDRLSVGRVGEGLDKLEIGVQDAAPPKPFAGEATAAHGRPGPG
jgi:hypothetical protein